MPRNGSPGEAHFRRDRMGDLPREGWHVVGIEDIEEPGHACAACGYPEVRYVHEIHHPEVEESLLVGCVCAEHLTNDFEGPRDAERGLRNRASRLARLLAWSRWRPGLSRITRPGVRNR